MPEKALKRMFSCALAALLALAMVPCAAIAESGSNGQAADSNQVDASDENVGGGGGFFWL